MRKLLKRISAVVCATALTVAMASTCFAADTWQSYFGQNMGWYEGAIGELTAQSEDSWTAAMDLIGWGGVWGAQVKDESLDLKKGTEYTLKFDMVSDTIDKWIFIKVADDEDTLIFGDWVQLKKGSKTSYEKTFTLSADATKIVFGIGGEFGDRTDEADMYELVSELPKDADAASATTIKCSNYSLEEKAAEKEEKEDVEEEKDDEKEADEEKEEETKASSNTGAVQTGDSTPIACAAVAVIAAAAVVVFTRKREDA